MPVMIRITAKRDGHRRAGMAHSGTRDYPEGTFSNEQLDALYADPMLVVDEVDVPDLGSLGEPEETDAEAKTGKGKNAAKPAPVGKAQAGTETSAEGGK
ncbi:HI1506-related protein [Desulfovibrio psychrotolerans]|uniref:Mu-like prophage FluMu N-terminal domain-containing protein n=1 Tax=Desulfovibrio psychrotolerans TaxID=415242 RepID=A0A7J0BVI4_9BACT|nr:HI1506-related protein [Desulfovibrio psychrotolerans]GFM37683.1 hypothetical protein DSM19430T_23670 [Desulfovibrio psychrotolerans]